MLLPSAVIIYSRFKSKGLYSKMSFSLCKPNENYMILIKLKSRTQRKDAKQLADAAANHAACPI